MSSSRKAPSLFTTSDAVVIFNNDSILSREFLDQFFGQWEYSVVVYHDGVFFVHTLRIDYIPDDGLGDAMSRFSGARTGFITFIHPAEMMQDAT